MKRDTMKRNNVITGVPALVLLMIAASGVGGCNRQATTASSSASSAQDKALPQQLSEDDEHKKESEELKAKLRVQHPDWSEQRTAEYVKGYLGFGISPETYAKTRAVLDNARSLRCQFSRGSYVDLANPELVRHESAGAEVTFDAIDRQRGHARIIAKSGAGDVTVITGPTALTFVEIAETGNPLVTVVFPRFRAGTQEFYAADSDHIFMFGDITVGQYYGSCTVIE